MKFLRVFCVLLFLNLADCLESAYNNQKNVDRRDEQIDGQIRNENSQNNVPQINDEINNSPHSPQYIDRKLIPVNNEAVMNQDFIRPQARRNDFNKNLHSPQMLSIQNRDEIYSTQEALPRQTIPPAQQTIISKPKDEVRYELQGASPEYMESFIAQHTSSPPKYEEPTYPVQSRSINVPKYINREDFATGNTGSYQNPTAEILYQSRQALPYRISNTLLKKQDSTNREDKITNSRQIQDIYTSARPEKRYTIIHQDGRIEYIDQIQSNIANNPHYVLLKPNDGVRYLQNTKNVNLPKAVKENPTTNPVIESGTYYNSHNINNPITIKNKNVQPDAKIQSVDSVTTSTTLNLVSNVNSTDKFKETNELKTVESVKSPLIGETNNNKNVSVLDIQSSNTNSSDNSILNPVNKSESASNDTLINNTNQSSAPTSTNTSQVLLSSDESDIANFSKSNDAGNIDDSKFMFKPNDQFWDKIINGTENIFYFLFVPPKPNTRETKTTVYPNGTSVTEVTETINDGDEEPKITKSIKSNKNETRFSKNI